MGTPNSLSLPAVPEVSPGYSPDVPGRHVCSRLSHGLRRGQILDALSDIVKQNPHWFRWPERDVTPEDIERLEKLQGSNGKGSRPSGDTQARVLWAPSDGPASDRRPRAQMAPAPSEPRATTLSSRDPVVHRPFGLFAAASDLLVPAPHSSCSRQAGGRRGVGRQRNEGVRRPLASFPRNKLSPESLRK